MIKVWFLMALMSYPNINAIHYKGYTAALPHLEECEDRSEYIVENMVAGNGNGSWNPFILVETYCMEMYAFPINLMHLGEIQRGINPAEFGA